MIRKKFLWFTDTHFDNVSLFNKVNFIINIRKEKPDGIFLTGDIANGFSVCFWLKLFAKSFNCPIYFVLGNHDFHFSSFEKIYNNLNDLCNKYENLIWLTNSEPINLNNSTCIIGTEGWYDASNGNSSYLSLTTDRFLIKELKNINSFNHKIKYFKELASNSANIIKSKLELALDQNYKSIYILTHFPPWKEATRDEGKLLENFWLPYNVNGILGKTIEEVMLYRKKRKVIVLSGHTHQDAWIHVSRNIECKVQKAKYYGDLRNEEHLFI